MPAPLSFATFLFTDIEGSTRLWEQEPERMRSALALHDALARGAVEGHRGLVVKTLGDGLHAAFDDPADALAAAIQMQEALADPAATEGIVIRIRCGLHAVAIERRNNDFFGAVVNRAARIMGAAHGGQVLLSQTVASLVADRLPGGVTLRDLGSVRLRGLTSPERVYQIVHPRLRQDFPALRSLEATPNNLPLQVTSFVGRERELAEAKKLLAEARLLTLLGAGGIGKTRLSLQIAADVLDEYPDGVWFVELAPVADPGLVPQTIASVVGVKEEAGRPVAEALVKYVKDQKSLLILDNCEHVVHACAELTRQMLEAGAHLNVLTSSREPLRVMGETTFQVPSLSIPATTDVATPEALQHCEAARLFVQRASAVQPAFRLGTHNAVAVADICRRLDGIPLALELAAARVRTLSVEKIAERLSDRFRLLTRGDQTALPRQQTLRALIDWSYELLTEHERALFRRLAVFAGGWTLEAAETVGADGESAGEGVLDVLTRLAEKSLVEADVERGRYRLLETVRQYAEERLEASGEDVATRDRHLSWCLAWAEEAGPALEGPRQGAWLEQLDLERENLLAAHRWCDHAQRGAQFGLRLVHAVKHYWYFRGLLGLGHRVTAEALARAGAQGRDVLRCRALFDAGQQSSFMGRYAQARGHLVESLAIAREIGDRPMIAAVLQPLGMAECGERELDAARSHLEEAVALERDLGNRRGLAAATNGLAQLHRESGALDAAEPLYEQVLALARELGDRESIAIVLLNLAMVSIGRGAGDRARAMLLEVLAIAHEIGSKASGQGALEVCAGLGAARREWERAARFFGAAEAQRGETELGRDPTDEAFLAPLMARARDALGTITYEEAERAGRALTYASALEEAQAWLGGAPISS